MADKPKLTPVEIQAIISALILAIQLLSQYVEDSTSLTDEEKQAFIDRIKFAQISVPDWK